MVSSKEKINISEQIFGANPFLKTIARKTGDKKAIEQTDLDAFDNLINQDPTAQRTWNNNFHWLGVNPQSLTLFEDLSKRIQSKQNKNEELNQIIDQLKKRYPDDLAYVDSWISPWIAEYWVFDLDTKRLKNFLNDPITKKLSVRDLHLSLIGFVTVDLGQQKNAIDRKDAKILLEGIQKRKIKIYHPLEKKLDPEIETLFFTVQGSAFYKDETLYLNPAPSEFPVETLIPLDRLKQKIIHELIHALQDNKKDCAPVLDQELEAHQVDARFIDHFDFKKAKTMTETEALHYAEQIRKKSESLTKRDYQEYSRDIFYQGNYVQNPLGSAKIKSLIYKLAENSSIDSELFLINYYRSKNQPAKVKLYQKKLRQAYVNYRIILMVEKTSQLIVMTMQNNPNQFGQLAGIYYRMARGMIKPEIFFQTSRNKEEQIIQANQFIKSINTDPKKLRLDFEITIYATYQMWMVFILWGMTYATLDIDPQESIFGLDPSASNLGEDYFINRLVPSLDIQFKKLPFPKDNCDGWN